MTIAENNKNVIEKMFGGRCFKAMDKMCMGVEKESTYGKAGSF